MPLHISGCASVLCGCDVANRAAMHVEMACVVLQPKLADPGKEQRGNDPMKQADLGKEQRDTYLDLSPVERCKEQRGSNPIHPELGK